MRIISICLLLQAVIVALGHHHHLNSSYNTNFIRWKRINIHVEAHTKKIYHNRFLSSSSSHKDSNKILLSEVSTVRKCGPDGDDRFGPIGHRAVRKGKPSCPSIGTFTATPGVEKCAIKCDEHRQCRSWSYEKESHLCIIYSQTLRSQYDRQSISGDVDVPLIVMPEAFVSSSGTYVCSCLENPDKVYNSFEYNNSLKKLKQNKKNQVDTSVQTCVQQQGCRFIKETKPSMKCPQKQSSSSSSLSVITISQPFGYAHFHFVIENLLRLATVPQELYLRENMKIQVFNKNDAASSWQVELLSFFGIPKENIITGEVFGNEVYVPSYTTCGAPSRRQVLSLRNVLLNSPKMITSASSSSTTTTTTIQSIEKGSSSRSSKSADNEIVVVLIERTLSRGLLNMYELKERLISLASEIGFVLKVYSDGEDATHYNQFTLLSMFSEASIIVAPHGAGLSNMIVSKPCATIIEARESSHPKCYVHLAQTLGFKYFSGCGNSGNTTQNTKDINAEQQHHTCHPAKGTQIYEKEEEGVVGRHGVIQSQEGSSIIEVEGGSEGRIEGEKVKIKVKAVREVSLMEIDIPYTIETVKNEVNWRRGEASSTSEEKSSNSYSHCLNNAKDYYSSFIQSTEDDHLLPLSLSSSNSNGGGGSIPNGPRYMKLNIGT